MKGVRLGLGTVGLGREWGARDAAIPAESQTWSFLESAIEAGIRFFDTAPAYGLSEERLGRFLRSLDRTLLDEISIATKCGEHFDPDSGETRVDHSSAALSASIDRSLELLPHVSLLQLHKPTPELVTEPRVQQLIAGYGDTIPQFGVSVTDRETARRAVEAPCFDVLQVPYNVSRTDMRPVLRLAASAGMSVIVSRVLGSGHHLSGSLDDSRSTKKAILNAFAHVLSESFDGVVLIGTKNRSHLLENIELFGQAASELSRSRGSATAAADAGNRA